MKPRLTLLNPIGGIGGAERVLLAMAKQLSERRSDWKLSAVLMGQGPLEVALAECGVEVHVLPLPGGAAELGDTRFRGRSRLARLGMLGSTVAAAGPGLLAHARKLRSLFNRLQPDLIHSNGLKSHLLSSLARPANVPLLWHVHDFYSQRPVMANVLRRLQGGIAGTIAISKAVLDDTRVVLPKVPGTLVYNGVDTERFCPGPGDGDRLDRLAGLPSQPGLVRIGLVATYANWKGHDVFLEAAARLPAGAARFYIVGGPIYSTLGSQFARADLEARAAALGLAGRIGFVPFQADPAEVYRALDVVVHASTRPEPFGLTIVEAMACGRAVIVAEAGGARELFTPDYDALGHTPGDAESLANRIESLIGDGALRAKLAVNARNTAIARFSNDRFGREIEAAFAAHLPAIRRRSAYRGPGRVLVDTPGEAIPRLVLPKTIAYFNPIGALGGAERSLLRIFAVMRRFAPQVKLHLLAGSDGPLLERAAELGVIAERFPLGDALQQLGESGLRGDSAARSRLRLLAAAPRVSVQLRATRNWLRNWLADHRPDLLHSNGLKTHLLTALVRPANPPLLWHVRDFLGGRPLMRWNLRWLAPRATLAIANSRAVAADARSVFGRLPVKVLYNSIDTDRFRPQTCDPSKLDQWAGLSPAPPGTLRIGLVATYANWKGHDVFLKAAARLPHPNLRIYLVGDPIYATAGSQFSRLQLEELASRLGLAGRVGFVPFRDDTSRVYGKLDVVVHASTRPEPFGLAIAEAMACGRPVVVSAAGGAKELFTEGFDALGHAPGDIDGLVAALKQLLDDPELRRRLGANARHTAEERYAEEPFARELLALYASALTEVRK